MRKRTPQLILAAVCLAWATQSRCVAQVFTPTQAQLLGLIDEGANFGGTNSITSVVPDANGGVEVSGTMVNPPGAQSYPVSFFDLINTGLFDTGPSPEPVDPAGTTTVNGGAPQNFTSFGQTTDALVNVSLVQSSAIVFLEEFAVDGPAEGANFAAYGPQDQNDVVILYQPGLQETCDLNFAGGGLTNPDDLIRYGFYVSPFGNSPTPPSLVTFTIDIDPVPEPASVALLSLCLPALLRRRATA